MRMPRIIVKSSILLLLAGPTAALAQSGKLRAEGAGALRTPGPGDPGETGQILLHDSPFAGGAGCEVPQTPAATETMAETEKIRAKTMAAAADRSGTGNHIGAAV